MKAEVKSKNTHLAAFAPPSSVDWRVCENVVEKLNIFLKQSVRSGLIGGELKSTLREK